MGAVDEHGHPIEWTALSGTSLQASHAIAGKLCDYVVKRNAQSCDALHLAVELKSRVQHLSAIVEQLQAGADLLQACPRNSFAAVLVYQRLGAIEFRALRSKRVTHRGIKYPIQAFRTPKDLASL